MECSHCGHHNPTKSKYCNLCGTLICAKDEGGARICGVCGKQMSYDVNFSVCKHCGLTHQISISKPNGSRARIRPVARSCTMLLWPCKGQVSELELSGA